MPDETIAGNKLIWEFMHSSTKLTLEKGYVRSQNISDARYGVGENVDWTLEYHSSFDWQIPAYSKIGHLLQDMVSKLGKEESDKYLRLLDKYESAIFTNDPMKGCQVIVEMIQWYNQNVEK